MAENRVKNTIEKIWWTRWSEKRGWFGRIILDWGRCVVFVSNDSRGLGRFFDTTDNVVWRRTEDVESNKTQSEEVYKQDSMTILEESLSFSMKLLFGTEYRFPLRRMRILLPLQIFILSQESPSVFSTRSLREKVCLFSFFEAARTVEEDAFQRNLVCSEGKTTNVLNLRMNTSDSSSKERRNLLWNLQPLLHVSEYRVKVHKTGDSSYDIRWFPSCVFHEWHHPLELRYGRTGEATGYS